MNSGWHIIFSSVFTTLFWLYSSELNLNTVPPVLIALTPIVTLSAVFYPDLDQRTHLLQHRSWLTHSAIVGLVLIIPMLYPNEASILLNIFCFNVGIHLFCDLHVPKKMVGYATVKLPTGKSTKARTIFNLQKSGVTITWLFINGLILVLSSIILL